jgi:hypothetical protein
MRHGDEQLLRAADRLMIETALAGIALAYV